MDNDTLSVINCHLECSGLSPTDRDEYGQMLNNPEKDKLGSEVRHLTGKLSSAALYRAMQVQAILDCLDSLPPSRSVMLCGDFNDTPISYAYQKLKKRLRNAYREGGSGVGVTYTEKIFPVRIDHIFHTPDWECTDAIIDHSATASDHYPVVARLKKREK